MNKNNKINKFRNNTLFVLTCLVYGFMETFLLFLLIGFFRGMVQGNTETNLSWPAFSASAIGISIIAGVLLKMDEESPDSDS